MKVRISWISKLTGHTGHGQWFPVATHFRAIEETAKHMNAEWSEILHWTEVKAL